MAAGRVASSESTTASVAEQAELDTRRGRLTRRETLWNQFDALMRAQNTANSGDKTDGSKSSEESGKKPADSSADEGLITSGGSAGKNGRSAKEMSEKEHDGAKSDTDLCSVGGDFDPNESKRRKKSDKSRKIARTSSRNKVGSAGMEHGPSGESKETIERQDSESLVGSSQNAGNSSTSKSTSSGHKRRKTTGSEARVSKGLRESHVDKDVRTQRGTSTSENGHSRSRSTEDYPQSPRDELFDKRLQGRGSPSGSNRQFSSGSLVQSRLSDTNHPSATLDEPFSLSRQESSESDYTHRSDINLSESLTRWVSHLSAEKKDSPGQSPRGMTPSVSPLPGDIPSYGKPVMPGYKPTSTKQESLTLPRPARLTEPLNPNPSLRDCIPIMPRYAAIICFVLNIFVPGLGTFFSALSLMCCGRARPIGTDIVSGFMNNCWAALLQLLSTPVLLVGWVWSVIWGLVFLELSAQPLNGAVVALPTGSSASGSRASDLSRTGRSSRASGRSSTVPGRSATVVPVSSSTGSQESRPAPIITLQESPVIISHNSHAELPHTSQLPQPAANSNHRYHRMIQRHQRTAAANSSNNDLPFLRAAHIDDFVRLSASVFGIAMVQSDGDNTAAAPTPAANEKA